MFSKKWPVFAGFEFSDNGSVAKAFPQFGHPLVECFGRLGQAQMFGLGTIGWAQPQVMLLIGPIQANRRGEVCDCIHSLIGVFWFG